MTGPVGCRWQRGLPVILHAVILKGLLDTHILRLLSVGTVSIAIPVGVTSGGITVIAIQLATTGRHPRGLHDLFTGVARWALRAVAYLALLTGVYPGAPLLGRPPPPTAGTPHRDTSSVDPDTAVRIAIDSH